MVSKQFLTQSITLGQELMKIYSELMILEDIHQKIKKNPKSPRYFVASQYCCRTHTPHTHTPGKKKKVSPGLHFAAKPPKREPTAKKTDTHFYSFS